MKGGAGGCTKSRPSGDGADGTLAVAVVGADGQGPLLADAHVHEAFVPAVRGSC